jgi:hypothetical protein
MSDHVASMQAVSQSDKKSKLCDVFHFDFAGKENSLYKLAAEDAMKIWQVSEQKLTISEILSGGVGVYYVIYLSYLFFSNNNSDHITVLIFSYIILIGPIIFGSSPLVFYISFCIFSFIYSLYKSTFGKTLMIDKGYLPISLKDFLIGESFNLYYPIYIEGQLVKMEIYGVITDGFSIGKHNPLIKDNGNYFSIGNFDQDLSDGFFYRRLKLKKCNTNKTYRTSSCICDNTLSRTKGSEISYKEARKIINSSIWPTNLNKDLILIQQLYIKKES